MLIWVDCKIEIRWRKFSLTFLRGIDVILYRNHWHFRHSLNHFHFLSVSFALWDKFWHRMRTVFICKKRTKHINCICHCYRSATSNRPGKICQWTLRKTNFPNILITPHSLLIWKGKRAKQTWKLINECSNEAEIHPILCTLYINFHTDVPHTTHICICDTMQMVAFWPFIFPNAIHTCTNCIQSSRTYTSKGKEINTKRWKYYEYTVDMMIENSLNENVQTRRMDERGNNTNNICLASDNQYHHKHHTFTHTNAWLSRKTWFTLQLFFFCA